MRISDWSSDVCSSDLVLALSVPVELHLHPSVVVDVDLVAPRSGHDRGLHAGHVRPWRTPGLAILHAAWDAGEAVAVAARAAIVAEVVAAAVPNRGDHVLFVERVLRVVGQGEAMARDQRADVAGRSEEKTSELQSLMRNSYAVFSLKKKTTERE